MTKRAALIRHPGGHECWVSEDAYNDYYGRDHMGYRVIKFRDEAPAPADPDPEAPVPEGLARPGSRASKADWVAYVSAVTGDTIDGDNYTVDDLVAIADTVEGSD